MSDTPRTAALLRRILERDGQVGPVNAPEELVTLARALERELAAVTAVRDALKAALEHSTACHE